MDYQIREPPSEKVHHQIMWKKPQEEPTEIPKHKNDLYFKHGSQHVPVVPPPIDQKIPRQTYSEIKNLFMDVKKDLMKKELMQENKTPNIIPALRVPQLDDHPSNPSSQDPFAGFRKMDNEILLYDKKGNF